MSQLTLFSSPAVEEPDWDTWINVSQIRNHVNGDPILDWLDYYGPRRDALVGKRGFWHGYVPDNHDTNSGYLPECDFVRFLIRKGGKFQQGVLKLIDQILAREGLSPVITIDGGAQSHAASQETLRLMEAGAPVIHRGVLWDAEDKVYGSPDLLVRSDVLNLIICDSVDAEVAGVPAPDLTGSRWHYVVVGLRFTTVDLDSNHEISNVKRHHKCQLALHTALLGKLQGYTPPAAYLIGRGWTKAKERGNDCLDRIGRFSIDQPQFRSPNIHWTLVAQKGVDWIRQVRAQGADWKVGDLPELRPNMSWTQDAPWHTAKVKIAEETGEITTLWQVGKEPRDRFIQAFNVDRWDHPDCTHEALGITSDGKGPRLEKILWINRDESAPAVWPPKIESARAEWIEPCPTEFFVDFETCSDLDDDFSALPKRGGQALIFMIGCGHIEDGQWQFRCFIADDLTPGSELKIIQEWIAHTDAVCERLGGPRGKVFHWSPAEDSTLTKAYNSARSRHGDAFPDPNWFDFLSKVVKPTGSSDCVVVKGAFGFGLKAIGKALHKAGLIHTKWEDGPADGLGAMCGAWWCYAEAKSKGIPVREIRTPLDGERGNRMLMREIRAYNEVDCHVMYEAITYLRQNH